MDLSPFDQALDRIGGISTLDSAGTRRVLDALSQEDEEAANRAARVDMLRIEFLRATQACDAKAVALFAGTTTDFNKRLHGGGYGKRPQTVGEVMHDVLEHKDYRDRAMQVLLNAAAGRGTQRDAQQLIEEVAAKWADDEGDSL